MSKAYLRICIDAGKESDIQDRLKKFNRVKRADITAGQQDLVVLVSGDSYEGILDFVVEEIRELEGVKTSWTNMVLE